MTGRFTTFNFLDATTSHLASQDYSQCIRQELGKAQSYSLKLRDRQSTCLFSCAGMCCIQYTACTDTNGFSLGGNNKDPAIAIAMSEKLCTLDYITIDGT